MISMEKEAPASRLSQHFANRNSGDVSLLNPEQQVNQSLSPVSKAKRKAKMFQENPRGFTSGRWGMMK